MAKRKVVSPKTRRSRNATADALAVFAHEVRTPLTGIVAASNLLASADLGPRERRMVETIKTGAEHIAALATLFVDAARTTHAGALNNAPFDLRALIDALHASLMARAESKGLQARVTRAATVPGIVTGDAAQLRAALENLIDNAVKFTDAGTVSLKVMRAARSDAVSFAVSDSGIGLTPAAIKRLFRPFSQASTAIAARYGGAGLGLWSVRQIALMMGGDVVATPQRRGVTFTLTARLPKAGRVAKPNAAAVSLRILAVEDNPFGRAVLVTMLGGLGHTVETVADGKRAAAKAARGTFDAVLMDMTMPGIDGAAAIRLIRAQKRGGGTIIIAMSGDAAAETRARSAGADGFLVKPISPAALATALLAALPRAAAAP